MIEVSNEKIPMEIAAPWVEAFKSTGGRFTINPYTAQGCLVVSYEIDSDGYTSIADARRRLTLRITESSGSISSRLRTACRRVRLMARGKKQ